MNMRRWVPLLVLMLLVVLPDVAHACPVCFDQNEKNRLAFFTTTIFLSALPLMMIAGMVWFVRKKMKLQLEPVVRPSESLG
jgi:hypothetical protein